MTRELAKNIAGFVSSQILMTQSTYDSFVEWLIAGNYDEEIEMADLFMRKGHSISLTEVEMDAFKKFANQ